MVYINGNDIFSAYTSGISVSVIFTQGVQVWPVLPSTSYYIRWTPSDLTGTFSIGGYRYYFEDYNGYFSNFDGTIPESAFEGTGVTMIETNAVSFGSSAFANCSSLVSVYLSNCSEIVNEGLFYSCTSLRTVSLPICTSIGKDAFRYCTSLRSIDLPEVLYVSDYGFRNCSDLSVVNLPKCKYLGNRAFNTDYNRMNQSEYKFLSINCPVCEVYSTHCFFGRYLQVTFNHFSCCKYIGTMAFEEAIGLITSKPVYDLPVCSYIGPQAFADCGFYYMNLSSVTTIESGAFCRRDLWENNEPSFRRIAIFTSSVCSLNPSLTFSKIMNGSWVMGAYIYVPSSLYSDYIIASGWSDISSYIFKITS